MADTATLEREPGAIDPEELPDEEPPPPPPSPFDRSRRRFIVAVVIGAAVTAIPMLWVAWDLWSGSINALRAVPYDNFYDLQARSMFHGHFNLPNGTMGIEAFVHASHDFTYFGIFPSLIRMPFLVVTSRLDGQMTAPSILAAWMLTGVFSSLMLWRMRILVRGRALMGRAEAASFGILVATIMGGSVVLYLSATPFVYNEDFAWSIPLTIGSLFALLGILERPSWGRVVAAAVLILCTSLNRTPTGYACTIGAIMVAVWFAVGRGGRAERRWTVPVLVAGGIGFLANSAVTYAKFGLPVGLPMADQVWAGVNAHRRYFLAANGGKAFSFGFLPSTVWAYLQPFGLHVTNLFPFITPPTAPAAALDGAVLDQTYPTASIPATMPLLFLLSCWGLVTAFRPRPFGRTALIRFVLIAGAAGAGGVLLWGYISERYMADFVPFLVVASGVGLIDVWRRLDGRARRVRGRVLGVIGGVGVYCVLANLAIAAGPLPQWSRTQTANFITAEESFSFGSLADGVHRGDTLPYWAPAGTLFATTGCTGLYLSSGNDIKDVPGQEIQHYTWIPVEQSPSFTRVIGFTFNTTEAHLTTPVTLMTYGSSRLLLTPAGDNRARIRLVNSGTSVNWPPAAGWTFPINQLHEQYRLTVVTDPNLNSMVVTWYGSKMIGHYVEGPGPARVQSTPPSNGGPTPVVTVADVPLDQEPGAVSTTSLCRTLLRSR